MRVIFLEDVPQIAKAGEVKEVADGYGRNFLLPRKLAALATAGALKQVEQREKQTATRTARIAAEAGTLAAQFNGMTVVITPKVGAQGRLYGSVTNAHIATEMQKRTGQRIDHRRVLLPDPIRQLGSYQVEVRLSSDISATITVNVQEAGAS